MGLTALWVAVALVIALLVDWRLGEPPVWCHPVVWIGRCLGWAGRRVAPLDTATPAPDPDYKSFWLGALAWCIGTATVCLAAAAVQKGVLLLPQKLHQPWAAPLAMLLLGLALKPLLAWAMLCSEVQAVEAALGESLQAGRERLSWLVSRDVSALSEGEVRESAIESLAENLNDSVVAPIFWFVLLGLPGAALYRFANTADAMWGYRGVRSGQVWEWTGKWTAWADDVLSWLPARITAVLLVLVSGGRGWRTLRTQARQTPSPNSGWPMAAMALALDVRLGKPGVYTLHATGRVPSAVDMHRAVIHARNALLALVVLVFVALFSIAKWI